MAPQPVELRRFHNHLVMQAGAYQNACWVVGAAKAGIEEGVAMMAGSAVISPHGEIMAQAQTEGDEIVDAVCDLDETLVGKRHEFNFAMHRRPEHYQLITATAEAGKERP
jgi:predicted amidohydrolase